MAKHISPNDFLGDYPPERIIGTETENFIQTADGAPPGMFISDAQISSLGLAHTSWHDKNNIYMSNGMRLYVDIGNHLEIASAEALGPAQAASADRAADLTLRGIIEASKYGHSGVYRSSGDTMPNELSSGAHFTKGYHENYLIPYHIADDSFLANVLASHIISRTWSWGGIVQEDGFELSQKARGIGKNISRSLDGRTHHGSKPIAVIRWEDVVLPDSSWVRAEVRMADPIFSMSIKYLAFASTSLALRLVENSSAVHSRKLHLASFRNPVKALHRFSRDLSFSATSETKDDEKNAALDYQELLIEQAHILADEIHIPESELAALGLWTFICDELRKANYNTGEYANLLGFIDSAIKHRYLSEKVPGIITSKNEAAAAASANWQRTLPASGAEQYWSRIRTPYEDREETERLRKVPPDTRAKERGRRIRRSSKDIKDISWSHVTYGNGKTKSLTNPYG